MSPLVFIELTQIKSPVLFKTKLLINTCVLYSSCVINGNKS